MNSSNKHETKNKTKTRSFNLSNIRLEVNTNLIYDPKLKSYEADFVKKVLALYPNADQLKITLDAGLAIGFYDAKTKTHIIVASELIEKTKAFELLGYEKADYFTDSEIISKF